MPQPNHGCTNRVTRCAKKDLTGPLAQLVFGLFAGGGDGQLILGYLASHRWPTHSLTRDTLVLSMIGYSLTEICLDP